MELTAIFESWHIGDGNYPPLARGDLVRLSFELEPTSLAPHVGPAEPRFEHGGAAEYRGVAHVVRRYRGESNPLIILEADAFRFYVYAAEAGRFVTGDWVGFAGTLLLDNYIWVEYLHTYPDPPDLFYNLRVTRIRKVSVPERFISRHEHGKALATRVAPHEFEHVDELTTMQGQPFDEQFFIVDFDDSGLQGTELAVTFR